MKSILFLSLSLAAGVASAERSVVRLDGADWTLDGAPVSVPHTWNAVDGADGEGPVSSDSSAAKSYARRKGVYAHALPDRKSGRRLFVRCLGASQKATVRVNGAEIGRHVGAYTAFAFEATQWLKPTGNVLEIEVDNIVDGDLQPAHADFTVYGGLYRGVELVETDPICIDCVTDGASGVRLEANAETGEVVARVSVDGGTNEVRRFSFPDRVLWTPENPKLYSVDVTVRQGRSTDTVRETFGFRTAEFRPDGFYLNGVRRKIRGVNYHQDMDKCGWAVSDERHAKDIALMKEMGADGLRTAHYPHAGATYSECDRQGLLVWCEYPNVNAYGLTEGYRRNALNGIREMIAQHRHHPSIVTWSVGNEYSTNRVLSISWLERLVGDFVAEARRLDPTRAIATATCRSYLSTVNMIADITGFNFYPGWYRREADEMRETIDAALAETPRQTIGVTEYGAGADIDCHESPDVRNRPLAPFHSEEYQAWVHHGNYLTLKNDDRVWGTFVWAMFDFGADVRREGSRFGLNDKGLVTFDHATPKDAFYFYKANWRPEPLLHLVGKRLTVTTNATVSVMAFWNGAGDVSLKVNGRDLGAVRPDDVKTAVWRNVKLVPGWNGIEVSAGGRTEKASWCCYVRPEPENVPALMPDGTTRESWEKTRRPEIVKTAFEAVYGVRPVGRPSDLAFAETAPAEECFGGLAVRKRVRATFSGPNGKGQMDFSVWIPKRDGPVPVFVHSSPRPAETAADPAGPRPVYLLPAEMIVRRGYAVVAYCNQDVSYDAWEGPEHHDKGVFRIFGPEHLDARQPREWGILSAWAWGVSRVADWVETEPLLDAKRMAVVGLSRNGKTALVAGVTDPRFALTVSCCSGCGGAKLNHIDLPKSESIRQIKAHGRWFAPEYFDWIDRDREMPFDQHQILALIAPRLLYVSSAQDDLWAGPDGEFHALRLASPAWALYGRAAMDSAARPPLVNEPVFAGSVGYHRRSGKHAILEYDWKRYLDFADSHGWNRPRGYPEPPPRPTPDEWVFQKELSAPEQDPAPDVSVDPVTGKARDFWLENRISRCFFGPIKRAPYYRDELMDDVDYYPEEYLKRLKREGVNGLWLTVEFKDLVETSFTKRDPNALKRYAKLNRTVEKCARHGIKIWVFTIEPATGPDNPLAKTVPQCLQSMTWNGGRTCCTATTEIRRYLEEATYDIFSHVPGLGGLINISHGERPTTCLSTIKFSPLCDAPPAEPCPRCSKLEPWQIHYNTLSAMAKGMNRADPDAKIISWFYEPQPGTWQDPRLFEIAKHLPTNVIFQYNFESGLVKSQCGKERVGGDYWLSEPGPGVPFTQAAAAAKEAGAPLSAKIQAICSHENACIPYVPVPGLLYRKFKGLHDLGVRHAMLCWYFGNYPGLMNRACGLLATSDFIESEDAFLLRLAKDSWGDEAETVAGLWKALSDAYANYPLTTFMQYYGPFHFGFVWPLYPKVELKPLSPTWKPDFPPSGDTIGECLGPFTLDEAIELADRMQIDGSAFPRLRAKFCGDRERLLDLGVMETLRYQFMSARNVFRFYKARDVAVKAAKKGDFAAAQAAAKEMRALIAQERAVSEAMIPLCEADGRLGFHSEAEAHQFYPARLKWRLGTLDLALRDLDDVDAALAAGRPYPQTEMDEGAATLEVAADGTIDLHALAGKNKFVLVTTLDETGCRFPFTERVENKPGVRYKVPETAERLYVRRDNVSSPPIWPAARYPLRHRLNLFGVEGRNFGRLLRK